MLLENQIVVNDNSIPNVFRQSGSGEDKVYADLTSTSDSAQKVR